MFSLLCFIFAFASDLTAAIYLLTTCTNTQAASPPLPSPPLPSRVSESSQRSLAPHLAPPAGHEDHFPPTTSPPPHLHEPTVLRAHKRLRIPIPIPIPIVVIIVIITTTRPLQYPPPRLLRTRRRAPALPPPPPPPPLSPRLRIIQRRPLQLAVLHLDDDLLQQARALRHLLHVHAPGREGVEREEEGPGGGDGAGRGGRLEAREEGPRVVEGQGAAPAGWQLQRQHGVDGGGHEEEEGDEERLCGCGVGVVVVVCVRR